MANPKDYPPSNSSRGSSPPPSDAASSGKENCYYLFLFYMLWKDSKDNPTEGTLDAARKRIVVAEAERRGWWVTENMVSNALPKFSGGTTKLCLCIEDIKDVIPLLEKELNGGGSVEQTSTSKVMRGYEISKRECKCKGKKEKCSGNQSKEFSDAAGSPISDKSTSYKDSNGKIHDLGATSTRAEKMQKIFDAEKGAHFPCCSKDKKKKDTTTTTAQKGTKLSTFITNLLKDN
tara:strand:- start:1243 stop:1941 length:699 start_codon:yes stop_codon:yes gene_type:complete